MFHISQTITTTVNHQANSYIMRCCWRLRPQIWPWPCESRSRWLDL